MSEPFLSSTTQGFKSGFVALVGKPNTGKSTLLNALAGAKLAAVSSKPQTTRTRIQGVVERPTAQFVLIDTPGVHRPRTALNREMMAVVATAIEGIDLILLVVDTSKVRGEEDRLAVETVRRSHVKSLLVLNKIDLIPKQRLLPLIEEYRTEHEFAEYIPLSALRGENLDRLEQAVVRHLPEGPPYFSADYLTDQPERFLAAEIIRENIFNETHQEVPYETAVVVDGYEESDRLVRIQATIVVAREGQKGILIGAQGQQLKRIGRFAREEIELMLGRKVHLELYVKHFQMWQERADVRRWIDWRTS